MKPKPSRREVFKAVGAGALLAGAWRHSPVPVAVQRLETVPSGHPSLHFKAPHVPALRARATGSHQRYAQILYRWIDEHEGWTPPQFDRRDGDEVLLEEAAAFVTNASLGFVLSAEPRYLELARAWALRLSEQPMSENRNYARGLLASGLARAYDWLYGELSQTERFQLQLQIRRLVEGLYRGSFRDTPAAEWWAGLYLHHDAWIALGGCGEAALALLGEVPEASLWAARCRAEFDTALSWLGEDGAWHEGAADWAYTLAPLLWFHGAWETKVDADLHQSPWIRSTGRYRLYHWLPDDTYIYLHDSFRSGRYNTSGSASCHLLRRLAGLFNDGHLQWLAARDETVDLRKNPKGVFRAPYEGLSFGDTAREYGETASQCAAWNVLWYDPELEPRPPDDLPNGIHFPDQGLAILRTGWDSDAAVVSLQCGSLGGKQASRRVRSGERFDLGNVHHAHVAYGAITLFARGQYLVVPAGYARRSSRFQNVVCVNGADFPADPRLEVDIIFFHEGATFCFTVADASEGFAGHLGVESYRRYAVLLGGDRLVVLDELSLAEAAGASFGQFEWRIHSDPSQHEIRVRGRRAEWYAPDSDSCSLVMDVLEPSEFAWERRSLDSVDGSALLASLSLVRTEWYNRRIRVLTAFSWAGTEAGATRIQSQGLVGVQWTEISGGPAVLFAESAARKPDWARLGLSADNTLLLGMSPPSVPAR